MLRNNQINLESEKERINPYVEYINFCVPRLLTLQDRKRFSRTYGCFDRPFWHFKTITDFPNATAQQAVLPLALLYKNDFSGNLYFKNKKILEYTIAGIKYWIELQHKDGSFDEFFPNEHSFVATAFTTYAIAESFTILQKEISSSDPNEVARAILRAGNWILKNNNLDVANQMLGASVALLKIFQLSGDRKFLVGSEQKMKLALKLQSKEGWFFEYGGADVGYLSLSIDFLAKYYRETKQEIILKSGIEAIRFLQYFIHPDGSVGGEYGSRNTQYILPHGLEIFSEYFDEANFILQLLYKGLKSRKSMMPLFSEDRYFSFLYLPNYIQALYQYRPKKDVESKLKPVCIFPDAKLISFQNNSYKVIIGVSKNGIIKIFEGEKLILSDAGFFCEMNNGEIATSQFLNLRNSATINIKGDEIAITVKENFIRVYDKLPMTKYLIPFRLFSYLFLPLAIFRRFFNKFLKRRLILRKKRIRIYFEKKITLNSRTIQIEDYVNAASVKLKRFRIERSGTAMYNASSTCFLLQEIENPISDLDDFDFASHLNYHGSMYLLRTFDFVNRTFNWKVSNKPSNLAQ